jgi:hypothetical protein
MAAKGVQYFLVGMFVMDGVAVPAQDCCLRKDSGGFLFHHLGTAAKELDTPAVAAGAGLGYGCLVVALVADEGIFGGMIVQAGMAAAALHYITAMTALD